MPKIVVTEYDPNWPLYFEEIRSYLWPAVQDVALAIEHVGSTAVPGLAAKPIIDVDIVIPPDQEIHELVARLEPLGYTHLGDLGITGREAFRRPNSHPAHHLYVCPADSMGLRNHLALRDYLRSHPDAVSAYGELKRRLAVTFPDDIDRYVDGKTDLITAMLREAGLATEDVTVIAQANRLS
jgi:GrpB-like predicted nucleotidyltransferase (UPF0157 family)